MNPNYAVIDLGVISGGTASYAYGINASGQVVGGITGSSFPHGQTGFLYANGSMQSLDNYTIAGYGINASGQIVGQQNNGTFITSAFLDSNGSFETLADGSTIAWGINTTGQIVGYLTTPYGVGGKQDAFLYSGGSIQDLHPQSQYPGANSQATAINDKGQAVGFIAPLGDANFEAVLFSSPVTYLGNLGGNYSIAYAINNNGQIVGVSATATGGNDVFLYANGSMQDIGTGAEYGNYGINNSGVVVGQNGSGHAFEYANGAMTDLNTLLVSANSGWTLQDASAINDAGQITGYGENPVGNIHAFQLNPCLNLTIPGGGYHQFDKPPAVPIYYGNTGEKSSTEAYGCLLCSEANMLTTYGISMTPADLDTALNNYPDGYSAPGDNVNWNVIGKAVNHPEIKATYQDLSKPTSEPLDQYLEEHCCGNQDRVILYLSTVYTKTKGEQENGSHYIFVTGAARGDWNVFDPGWSRAWVNGAEDDGVLNSLNGHLASGGFWTMDDTAHWQFSVVGAIAYSIGVPSGGQFSTVAQCPLELLVTDPNGNRVGYDPTTGTDVIEIPNASYMRQYPIANAEGDSPSDGDTNGVKILNIPNPVGGSYQIKLIGTGLGNYEVDTSTYWGYSGGQSVQATAGTTDVGVITTNTYFTIVPPVLSTSIIDTNSLGLSFTSQSNVAYVLEGKSTVDSASSWTTLQTFMGTGTITTATRSITSLMMFYRVRTQ